MSGMGNVLKTTGMTKRAKEDPMEANMNVTSNRRNYCRYQVQ